MPEAALAPSLAGVVTTDRDRPMAHAPTILAALTASTPEERAADPTKASQLAVALTEIMHRWAQHHEGVYREADENADFFRGLHYGYQSPALNYRVALPPAPSSTVRLTYNYIRRGVERMVSIILKDPPIIKCLAGDSEVLDQAASEAADDIVEWRQRCAVLAAEPERVARAAGIAGWCWIHEEYDETAGAPIATGKFVPPTPEDFAMDPAALPQPEMVPSGQFVRDLLTYRQGVPDPTATHPLQGSGFFIRKRMSRFDLHVRFPELDIAEHPADGDEKLRRVTDLGRGITSAAVVAGGTIDSTARDDLEVDLLYVPKCPEYPKGRRILFTEKSLLEERDNPRYPTDDELKLGETEPNPSEEPCWPVFPFVHMHREQSPFGFSPVHDAIQPNKAINGMGSAAVMHGGRIAHAKVKVPNDLAQEWDNQTGQVFKVPRRNFDHNTLGFITPPQMPPEYMTIWNQNKDALYEFLGLNQPAVGQQESTGQSGYAIKLRQDTADNDLEKVRGRHNAMWACLYRYDVFLVRRHWDTPRKIAVLGENRRTVLRALDKTALLPATNVLCVNDAAIPRNPAERMIWLQQFMQTGVMALPNEQRQEMFQLMRLQDFKAFEERKQVDRMRANRQIDRIKEGLEPGGISDMDDHLVQMAVIREFGLSEEFEYQVEQELQAAQQQQAGGVAPPAAGQSASPSWTRLNTLYEAHKAALIAQTQASAPPPAAGPGAAASQETALRPAA